MLQSAPQNGIIKAHLAKWKPVRRRNKKTPQKSTGKTDYANFASLAQSLVQFQISMLDIERRSVLQAIQNGCSFSNFITVPDLELVQRLKLNPKIVHRTILTHQSVRSKLFCKSCATNIEAAAKSSHQCCFPHSKEKHFAVISTAKCTFDSSASFCN